MIFIIVIINDNDKIKRYQCTIIVITKPSILLGYHFTVMIVQSYIALNHCNDCVNAYNPHFEEFHCGDCNN